MLLDAIAITAEAIVVLLIRDAATLAWRVIA
jgi:hypothetical protein